MPKNAGKFEEVRTAKVMVQYLRGISNGYSGWWVIDTCATEPYSGLCFLNSNDLPTKERIAEHVIAYGDADHEGISGKGGQVLKKHQDNDSALFEVTARVLRWVPNEPSKLN